MTERFYYYLFYFIIYFTIIIYLAYDAIFTPSGNVCRATVGVAVGTCVLLITGVIVAVFVIR